MSPKINIFIIKVYYLNSSIIYIVKKSKYFYFLKTVSSAAFITPLKEIPAAINVAAAKLPSMKLPLEICVLFLTIVVAAIADNIDEPKSQMINVSS